MIQADLNYQLKNLFLEYNYVNIR